MGDPLLPLALLKSPRQPLYADDFKSELTKRMQLTFEVTSQNLQAKRKAREFRNKRTKDCTYKEGDQCYLYTPRIEWLEKEIEEVKLRALQNYKAHQSREYGNTNT